MIDFERLRNKAGLSQEALARVMGLSRMTIANWEKGKTEPSASQIKFLADIFGVTTDQLLGQEDSKQTSVHRNLGDIPPDTEPLNLKNPCMAIFNACNNQD